MYAAVRRYHVKPGRIAEVARRVQEGLVPILTSQRGFLAYHAIDVGDNVAVAIGLYENRRAAEAGNEQAAQWVQQNLADLLGPGEIAVGRVIASASLAAGRTNEVAGNR